MDLFLNAGRQQQKPSVYLENEVNFGTAKGKVLAHPKNPLILAYAQGHSIVVRSLVGHQEVIQFGIERTPDYELQECVGLAYTDDGAYLVSVFLQRSKFSPSAGEAHTLLVTAYDVQTNYSQLSSIQVPLPTGTSLASMAVHPLFHRGDLHYHTLQLVVSTPTQSLSYLCTFLYGQLSLDYRSRMRVLARDAPSQVGAWAMAGMRFLIVDLAGSVKVFSIEGENFYLDLKHDLSTPVTSAALSRLSDTLYTLSVVPNNNSGVLTLLHLQLTPTPVLAECGQVRVSTQGVRQVAAAGDVVAVANSSGEVIMYSFASGEVYQKISQIALLSEAQKVQARRGLMSGLSVQIESLQLISDTFLVVECLEGYQRSFKVIRTDNEMLLAKQEIERAYTVEQIEIIPLMRFAKTFFLLKRYSKAESAVCRVYFNGVSSLCEPVPQLPNGVSTMKVVASDPKSFTMYLGH
jgi:hypothetical protein